MGDLLRRRTQMAQAEKDKEAGWEDGVPYTVNLVSNSYVATNGAFLNYNGWSRTDYLPCHGASEIQLAWSGTVATYIRYHAFYDENKNYLSSPGDVQRNCYLTVPDDAYYYVCSAADATMNAMTITPHK